MARPRFEIFPFKWYYEENLIFPIAAILEHKQVACVRRMLLIYSNISFRSRDIQVFKICKLAQ